jgi:hypothetical protein
MNNRHLAIMYRRGTLRDLSVERDARDARHLDHHGSYLKCHATEPPPVSEYEEWFEANAAARGRKRIGAANASIDGRKLRRAVSLIRNGHSCRSAAKCIALSPNSLAIWLEKLPPELRP